MEISNASHKSIIVLHQSSMLSFLYNIIFGSIAVINAWIQNTLAIIEWIFTIPVTNWFHILFVVQGYLSDLL